MIHTTDFLAGGAGWGSATAELPDQWIGLPDMPEETLGAAFGSEGLGAAGDNMADFLLVMIAFLFVDIFDTSGTLYSVGRQAGYVDENDVLHNSDEAFASDAAATIVGAVLGTSTTTTYIESAAGCRGRRKDRTYSSGSGRTDAFRTIIHRPVRRSTSIRYRPPLW